ncbi:poly-beta-1,6-N-acetyl-D-glucosamine biosynthesis protein PgaD [Luteimonas sp. SX5]|uniref:Poly-beta-1,6-N-acetyl-D-glucosamine biosynthesis protein PgaD n=1 Tax=Luteimonas galliterrae TaxID=2940486 RepID=A0ABT0MGW4_9GAMM|nr:poly-beta-1,6-N-acetyl-D-glucosamine biosynthesis protein PgaD [Luteimonas galliterrae]MCL1633908.1 poly-beta-1,6-N-acetyl-D-glucosamine biosynthesis protein PgaD [Luteimonas galliterrae]
MKFDSSVIHKPRSQPALQRGFFSVVTFAFWLAYAYMWLPLLTLFLWLLGVRTAVFELYLREHQVEPFLLVSLPVLALASATVLIAWAEYNRWRFRAKDRRSAQPDIGKHDIALAFGSSQEIAQALSASKVALLKMDDAATPMGVSILA